MRNRKLATMLTLALGLGLVLFLAACGTPEVQKRMYYQGRLTDNRGNPIDGTRNLVFRLYTVATEGTAVWQETHNGVDVVQGLFSVVLGTTTPLDPGDFHRPLWIEVVVQGQTLADRQPLYGSPYAFSLVPGSLIKGNIANTAAVSTTLSIANFSSGQALAAAANTGVTAYFEGGGQARNSAVLRVYNRNATQGMATYMVNKSGFATAHFSNSGTGQVLWLTNGGTNSAGSGGGDFIRALNKAENDAQFRVLTSGEARSDAGFNTPAADMAEMLPAAPGLEPGDTLVLGADGKLTLSSEPYQTTVVGVYSTQPGFVGGQPVDEELEGHVPLGVAGIVPVKVTAEAGPIQPGDLLTTSSTPGHAMKATEARPGTIIGKALSGLDEAEGVIRMLIMLR